MPAPRTPLAKAKLTGALKNHPERFKARSEPKVSKKPVGNPPPYLSKDARDVWKEAAASMGWLVKEDRFALEVMANAVGLIRETVKAGETISGAMINAANTAVGKIGASPTERGKVFQPGEDEDADDPFAAFGRAQ